MEETKKPSSVFIIIIILLLFIVGCLLGYICLNKDIDKTSVTNKSNNVEEKNTVKNEKSSVQKEEKSNSIVGEYQYTIEGSTVMNNITGKIIDFMEDGTYYEKVMSSEINIIYGEYKIEGNTITLVEQFRHNNSQDGLIKTQNTYTYEYNTDGTIIDSSNINTVDNSVLKQTYKKNNKVNEVKKELINYFISDIENHK